MKKIALFVSAMVLCAGIAMAQEPVKKPAKKATEPTASVAKPDKAVPAAKAKDCGNCPNHKDCKEVNAKDGVKPTPAAKPAAKPVANPSKKDAGKPAPNQNSTNPTKK